MPNKVIEMRKAMQLVLEKKDVTDDDRKNLAIEILKKYSTSRSASALAMAFEILYVDKENGTSPIIQMSELEKLHPGYKTTNGNDWCRNYRSYLGSKYEIKRDKNKKHSVDSIQVMGVLTQKKAYRIRKDIVDAIVKMPCAILNTHVLVECDHKNGHRDQDEVINLETQEMNQFQPLCKVANDVKDQHCIRCCNSGKRFDAKLLGYKESFTHGNIDTTDCVGCYWYDPKKFNEEISADFKKKD